MQDQLRTAQYQEQSLIATNKLLRQTYMLLAMTLAFSALTAGVSMAIAVPFINPFITIGLYFVLLFAVEKTKNSAAGLFFVFALTGWMGFTLGPILNFYTALPNGSELVMLALGGTAAIFFTLSGIALFTQKDFSFMAKFVITGLIVAFIAAIANIFMQIPALQLAVCCMFLLLSSAVILMQTSAIIHGGETNYISATVTLYVSIYNIFLSLLQLLGIFGGDD